MAFLAGCGPFSSGREGPVSEETGLSAKTGVPPAALAGSGYVEDSRCRGCHLQQYDDWLESHHDLAMQEATEDTVLGDFDDASFHHFGVESRFFRRDGGFFIITDGPDGTPGDFEIRYTFGVEPLQQYLVPLPGGRLQALGIAWDTVRGAWFHLYPDEAIPAGDPFHWTGWRQNWNSGCADCHSTNLEVNYDAATRTYRTTWNAIDVGCQACHGPGGRHLAWADERRPAAAEVTGDLGLGVRYGDSAFEVESCAACHSLRSPIHGERSPADTFFDRFRPTLLDAGFYHADGQILGEAYEYGSFVQSRMFAEGVRCSDCHNPHSLGLRVLGNAVCEQCHHPDAPLDRFPTLTRKTYNSPEHHFHPEGSDGARCVNCHMPERTYMVVDPRRDHSFRIPRPDLSAATGSPDACTTCHAGESPEWAAERVAAWYGPGRRRGPHYGEAFAAAREDRPGAVDDLIVVAGDDEQPPIARATALRYLSAYGPGGAPRMPGAFEDAEPVVRMAAAAGLGALPPAGRLRVGARLLRDPLRAVRVEAAEAIAPAAAQLAGDAQSAFGAARVEFEAAAAARADHPDTHYRLGNFHTATGDHDRAVRDYRRSLSLDPAFWPASRNLAVLLSRLGRNPEAEVTLQNALARTPDAGDAHYSLGLLLAERGQLEAALGHLERAAALLPEQARAHYNHGLALQRLGRPREAEAALRRADSAEPDTPAFLNALAILHAQQGRWTEALPWAERAVELRVGPDAVSLLERIRTELSR